MQRKFLRSCVLVAMMGLVGVISVEAEEMKPPFGDAENVAYAAAVWAQMEGYRSWKMTTDVYPGKSPHGAFLRLFSSYVTVNGASHPIIVKENYGGRGVSAEGIAADQDAFLAAVTIMLQRIGDSRAHYRECGALRQGSLRLVWLRQLAQGRG